MADESFNISPRLEELQEKYDKDPSSTIFLQLAEEYRKSKLYEEAVEVCEAGLKKHPNYTSARVTLGRSLMGAKRTADARAEFEKVLKAAPDNITANKCLGDIHFDEGRQPEALKRYKIVQALNPADEDVQRRILELEGKATGVRPVSGPSVAPAPPPPPAPPANEPRPSARQLFGENRSVSRSQAAEPVAPEGEAHDDFMDLKIDESLILNAQMIQAALSQVPPAAAAAPAPSAPPIASAPRPVPAPTGPTSAMHDASNAAAEEAYNPFAEPSEPEPAIGFGEAEPEPEPAEVPEPSASGAAVESAAELGDMAMDDFSEFSAPTVMLNAADLQRMAGIVPDEPEPTAEEPDALAEEPAAAEPWLQSSASGPKPLAIDDAFPDPDLPEDLMGAADAASELDEPGFAAPAPGEPLADADESPFSTVFAPPEPGDALPEPFELAEAGADAVEAEAEPGESGVPELASRTLGDLYLQQGHVDKARAIFEEHVARHPEDMEARYKLRELERRARESAAPAPPARDLDFLKKPAPAPSSHTMAMPAFDFTPPEPPAPVPAPAAARPAAPPRPVEVERESEARRAEPVPARPQPPARPEPEPRVAPAMPRPAPPAPTPAPVAAAPPRPRLESERPEPVRPPAGEAETSGATEEDRKEKIRRLNKWLSTIKKT